MNIFQRGLSKIGLSTSDLVGRPAIAISDNLPAVTSDEERSLENPATPLSGNIVFDGWGGWGGGLGTDTGLTVNADSALRFSAVYACINIIAETAATLPRAVYDETPEGREIAKDHALQYLFEREPNEHQTWFDFIHAWVVQALTHGNGFAYIERDKAMRPKALHLLEPGECSPYFEKIGPKRRLFYYVWGQMMPSRDILHLKCLGSDGVIGKSPITLFRENIGLGLAAERYTSRFFQNGTTASVVLKHPQTFRDQASVDRLRTQFADRYSGISNAHKPIILEQGMDISKLSIDPKDAELINTRKLSIEDIARIYRVPLHKLQDLSRSTNNNIEHQSLEFISDTMMPWTQRISEEMNRKLLAEAEKGDKYIWFDLDHIRLSDLNTRANYYKTLYSISALSPNEARREARLNRKDGLDDVFAQSQYVRVTPDSHQWVDANTNKPTSNNGANN